MGSWKWFICMANGVIDRFQFEERSKSSRRDTKRLLEHMKLYALRLCSVAYKPKIIKLSFAWRVLAKRDTVPSISLRNRVRANDSSFSCVRFWTFIVSTNPKHKHMHTHTQHTLSLPLLRYKMKKNTRAHRKCCVVIVNGFHCLFIIRKE